MPPSPHIPMGLVVLVLAIVVALVLAVLAIIAWKLGLLKTISAAKAQPYRCSDRILSEAEAKFHTALTAALPILCKQANRPDAPLLFAKVRLGDVLETDRGKAPERSGKDGWQAARNKIDRKHVDFLLCHPITTKPLLVIELDDNTHNRPDRQQRDQFLDDACAAAKLPVLHVRCIPPTASYDARQLAADMAKALDV